MGRHSKFTPETQEKICQLIRVGNRPEIAADASGINRSTFYRWQQTRPRFRDAVAIARSEAEAILVGRVQQAATKGSWRAACWLLERQWPERWAPLTDRGKIDAELERELNGILAKT